MKVAGFGTEFDVFDAFVENPNSTDFLLNKDYDEIGVSTFIGELNGCPVQVVVQHLAGYIPPKYNSSDIENWKNGLTKLKEIQPSWEKLKTYEAFYKDNKTDIDRINDIISIRTNRISALISRMEAGEWFTDEEKKWMDEDSALGVEQNQISERLNAKNN
jgi:hypothetical protein